MTTKLQQIVQNHPASQTSTQINNHTCLAIDVVFSNQRYDADAAAKRKHSDAENVFRAWDIKSPVTKQACFAKRK